MSKPVVLTLLLCSIALPVWCQKTAEGTWHFAVSGDSRNCGDVVMPTIVKSVLQHHAEFYWHMGDFRAMYGVDEDMNQQYDGKLSKEEYLRIAWGDFLANQIAPFGSLPVYLGIGNHELLGQKTLADFIAQFGYWLDKPELRAQRSADDPQGATVKPYYHWKTRHVDFIYLDNSGSDGFDDAQLLWFEKVLDRDKSDKDVLTIVVGMHRALPNSLACGHSMNGDPPNPSEKSLNSGRRAYNDLAKWKTGSGKFVYVLASHSHFYMEDLFDTVYWQNPKHGGEVLPGWIVGTAGAMRYNLPDLPEDVIKKAKAQTDVWGYLLATVHENGKISFDFEKLGKEHVPEEIRTRYGDDFVDNFCFKGNHDSSPHPPAASCQDQ
jgi:Calcineurin-like phosphoesterase